MGDKDLIALKQKIDDFAKSHLRGHTTQSLLDAGTKEVGYKKVQNNYFCAMVKRTDTSQQAACIRTYHFPQLPNFNFDFVMDINVMEKKLPIVSLHCLSLMKLEALLAEQRIKAGKLGELSDPGNHIASYGKEIENLNAKMSAWTREMECLHRMVDSEIYDYYDQGSDGSRP